MMSKGLIAGSLLLLAGFATSDPYTITSSHTPVTAGMSVKITVTDAPCHPLTVTLWIDGKEIKGTIDDVPGSVTLDVPANTQGEAYSLEISCDNDRSVETGFVI
jgi:hypothetical protein